MEILAFTGGAVIVVSTVLSAVRTVVLPHGRSARATRWWFGLVRLALRGAARLPGRRTRAEEMRSLYAPLALVALPLVWLTTAAVGFTAIFWALDTRPLLDAFKLAGSSMLTLGFFDVDDGARLVVSFFGAALTIALLALLLVTYLPTIYQAYSARETALAALETYAGEPPHPAELLLRFHRIGAWEQLPDLWEEWQRTFFELRETHTALPAVALFASSTPRRHWVSSVEALLDGAALRNAAFAPRDPRASLCLRAGRLALADIAATYGRPFLSDPQPDDPVDLDRSQFDELYDALVDGGVSPDVDREQAWIDWRGWRVNYDASLLGLADLVGVELRHQTRRQTP